MSRSLISEEVRDVSTGSRVTTPVTQGGCKAQWEVLDQLCMAPGNAAHPVLSVLLLLLLMCSAGFAEAALIFRAQKHRAKLVWVRKMLWFDRLGEPEPAEKGTTLPSCSSAPNLESEENFY